MKLDRIIVRPLEYCYICGRRPACSSYPCQLLSDAEKADPQIRQYWMRRWPWEKLGPHLDPGIAPLVKRCLDADIPTLFSCDGHGYRPPEIDFFAEVDANRAIVLFADLGPEKKQLDWTIARFWRVRFPMSLGLGTPKKRKTSGE
jgi:hypothetical protein